MADRRSCGPRRSLDCNAAASVFCLLSTCWHPSRSCSWTLPSSRGASAGSRPRHRSCLLSACWSASPCSRITIGSFFKSRHRRRHPRSYARPGPLTCSTPTRQWLPSARTPARPQSPPRRRRAAHAPARQGRWPPLPWTRPAHLTCPALPVAACGSDPPSGRSRWAAGPTWSRWRKASTIHHTDNAAIALDLVGVTCTITRVYSWCVVCLACCTGHALVPCLCNAEGFHRSKPHYGPSVHRGRGTFVRVHVRSSPSHTQPNPMRTRLFAVSAGSAMVDGGVKKYGASADAALALRLCAFAA